MSHVCSDCGKRFESSDILFGPYPKRGGFWNLGVVCNDCALINETKKQHQERLDQAERHEQEREKAESKRHEELIQAQKSNAIRANTVTRPEPEETDEDKEMWAKAVRSAAEHRRFEAWTKLDVYPLYEQWHKNLQKVDKLRYIPPSEFRLEPDGTSSKGRHSLQAKDFAAKELTNKTPLILLIMIVLEIALVAWLGYWPAAVVMAWPTYIFAEYLVNKFVPDEPQDAREARVKLELAGLISRARLDDAEVSDRQAKLALERFRTLERRINRYLGSEAFEQDIYKALDFAGISHEYYYHTWSAAKGLARPALDINSFLPFQPAGLQATAEQLALLSAYCRDNIFGQFYSVEEEETKKITRDLPPQDKQGKCPNCNATISLVVAVCPKCKAAFGADSAWKIEPL